jgi:PAS domain S-box-containing protein
MQGKKPEVLVQAGVIIAAIAAVDWRFDVDISFGFLYLFPMLMVGGCLTRPQIAAVAALCTGLSEAFDPFHWTIAYGVPRLILTFAAFFGAGLYVFESARSRRFESQHLEEVEKGVELRREAEEQLRFLIESSPAAIFTLDANRKVLLANEAAHRLFGVEPGKLEGQAIGPFLPALAHVPLTGKSPLFRTAMECRGRRQDGEVFLAQAWFSTYGTLSGPRLAAVVFDASEDLRDREEHSLEQLLAGSKMAVSAVCHEMRNICGAIEVVHAKLARDEQTSQNDDFRALGSLVEGLGKMAGLELKHSQSSEVESTDVRSVLEELRIVTDPAFHDRGITTRWEAPEFLPPVWADRAALLQAFLNIAKNSQRAMEREKRKELTVKASLDGDSVVVRFIDTGCGVAAPEHLFQPFQRGAEATGLGLYLSRGFVRTFHGDIKYEPQPAGSCFAVMLAPAELEEASSRKEDHAENPSLAAGRSHSVPGEPEPAAGHGA